MPTPLTDEELNDPDFVAWLKMADSAPRTLENVSYICHHAPSGAAYRMACEALKNSLDANNYIGARWLARHPGQSIADVLNR
jgi:hypothetical protein